MRGHSVISQCLAKFEKIPSDDSRLSKARENLSLTAVEFGSCRYTEILMSPPMLPQDECVRS